MISENKYRKQKNGVRKTYTSVTTSGTLEILSKSLVKDTSTGETYSVKECSDYFVGDVCPAEYSFIKGEKTAKVNHWKRYLQDNASRKKWLEAAKK